MVPINNHHVPTAKRLRNEDVKDSSSSVLDSLINPEFEELASHFPEFRQAYRRVVQTQCGRPFATCITQEFSIALTKALLQTTWGISLTDLPLHHLCPPVPNRYFLIHWLQHNLLPKIQSHDCFASPRRMTFTGLDVGTGATCIYPLLFMGSARKNASSSIVEKWRLWASDVDAEAIDWAKSNVRSNQLQSSIHPILVPMATRQSNRFSIDYSKLSSEGLEHRGPLRQSMEAIAFQKTSMNEECLDLDFCVTNPPFYDNDEERVQVRQGDGRSRTSMTVHEGTYAGGEVGFATDILLDQCHSLLLLSSCAYQHQDRHHRHAYQIPGWTVIMCGKKTSFVTLYNIVSQMLGFTQVCSTEFGPGQLTRWFLAWTWHGQPCSRSPLAANDSFEFSVENEQNNSRVAMDEVKQRLFEYAQEFSLQCMETELVCDSNYGGVGDDIVVCQLELWMAESIPDAVGTWVQDDKLLPSDLAQALARVPVEVRGKLLPPQGHFLLIVEIGCSSISTILQVHTCIYTFHGKREVAKFKQHMPGEITRTNRKWRRRRQRQHS